MRLEKDKLTAESMLLAAAITYALLSGRPPWKCATFPSAPSVSFPALILSLVGANENDEQNQAAMARKKVFFFPAFNLFLYLALSEQVMGLNRKLRTSLAVDQPVGEVEL